MLTFFDLKTVLLLLLGVAIGAGAWWFLTDGRASDEARQAGQGIKSAAQSARDVVQRKLKSLDLDAGTLKEGLERTGKFAQRKAGEAGNLIADATADARTTAAVKSRLLALKGTSALSISVNTTAGLATLSGAVEREEDIGLLMNSALEVDGVREVVSTLQVIPAIRRK